MKWLVRIDRVMYLWSKFSHLNAATVKNQNPSREQAWKLSFMSLHPIVRILEQVLKRSYRKQNLGQSRILGKTVLLICWLGLPTNNRESCQYKLSLILQKKRITILAFDRCKPFALYPETLRISRNKYLNPTQVTIKCGRSLRFFIDGD